MSLSLKITSYQRLTPGQQSLYTAQSDSFTIGRGSENDWVIPDPQRFLSGVHCRIEKSGDGYVLVDLSTNGVFYNGATERIPRNSSVPLSHGDRFRIGDYEFEVLEGAGEGTEEPATEGMRAFGGDDPFGDYDSAGGGRPAAPEPPDEDEFDPFADAAPAAGLADVAEDDLEGDFDSPVSHMSDNALGQGVDIDEFLDLDEPQRDDEPPQSGSSSFSAIEEPMSAPRAAGAPAGGDDFDIPDNWDEATGMLKVPDLDKGRKPAPAPTSIPDNWDEATGYMKAADVAPPPPAREPAPPAQPAQPPSQRPAPSRPASSMPAAGRDALAALNAFARGAGLKPEQMEVDDIDRFFERIGSMIKAYTDGAMRTLSGRSSVKSEFRLDQTMIRPVENNPLKFSPLVEDALKRLLHDSDQAYTSGAEAVRESFDDINAHQIAVMAGMEAALQGLLKRFRPETLEKRLVSHSILDNILPGAKKAKYWDIFTLLYNEIARDAEDDFQQLFGKEFSRAYEAQLDRLKHNRRE